MKIASKRIILAVTLIAMILSVMSGCGSSSSAAQTPEETSKEAPKENAVLKFITLSEWEKAEVVFMNKALTEQFYPQNPDMKIEFEMVPFSDLDKKIVTAHAGGVDYDIVTTNNPSVGVFADGGIIAPLDDYITKSGIDFENAYNKSFASAATYKGIHYSMPFETDCRVLAINKKMFADAGIEPPKTMDDMLNAAKALTKDTNGDGKPDQYGMIMDFGNVWYPTYDLGQWLLGNGAHLYKQDGDKYTATINTPEALDFLNWAMEMSKYQPSDFVSYDGAKITAAFSQGKVGMFVFGPWMFNDPVLNESKLDYQLILNPAGKVKSGSSMGGWLVSMGANTKYKEQAWKFLDFISKPEINAAVGASLPPIFEAYKYPPYNDPKYQIFAEQLKTAELPNPVIPALNEVADVWNKYFQKAILKAAKPEEALAGAQKDMQEILDKAGK